MMVISALEPKEVEHWWPHIVRWIEASQRRGPRDMGIPEMRWCCITQGDWRLLVFDNCRGAAIIRILNNALHVVALGGQFHKGWHVEFVEWLRSVAKFHHLPRITLAGRKGWRRLLAPQGFVPVGGCWLACPVDLEEEL